MVGVGTKNQRLDAAARCLAAACLIAVIFATFRLFNGADTPFLAFSVVGAAVVHFANRPHWIEATITAVLASLLGIAYVGSRGIFGQYPDSGLVGTCAFLGLASMLVWGGEGVPFYRGASSVARCHVLPGAGDSHQCSPDCHHSISTACF